MKVKIIYWKEEYVEDFQLNTNNRVRLEMKSKLIGGTGQIFSSAMDIPKVIFDSSSNPNFLEDQKKRFFLQHMGVIFDKFGPKGINEIEILN